MGIGHLESEVQKESIPVQAVKETIDLVSQSQAFWNY